MQARLEFLRLIEFFAYISNTGNHSKIVITTSDGEEFYGYVHGVDTLSDLAIIKLKLGQPSKIWKKAKLGNTKFFLSWAN